MSSLELLREVSLFSDCTEERLQDLASILEIQEFANGESLFSHGDDAHGLLVPVAGEVRLDLPVSILGEPKYITFEFKRRGDVLGWSALVPPHVNTLSAHSNGATTVAFLHRERLEPLFVADPQFGFSVMRSLAAIVGERLRRAKELWAREIQRALDERYR